MPAGVSYVVEHVTEEDRIGRLFRQTRVVWTATDNSHQIGGRLARTIASNFSSISTA